MPHGDTNQCGGSRGIRTEIPVPRWICFSLNYVHLIAFVQSCNKLFYIPGPLSCSFDCRKEPSFLGIMVVLMPEPSNNTKKRGGTPSTISWFLIRQKNKTLSKNLPYYIFFSPWLKRTPHRLFGSTCGDHLPGAVEWKKVRFRKGVEGRSFAAIGGGGN